MKLIRDLDGLVLLFLFIEVELCRFESHLLREAEGDRL